MAITERELSTFAGPPSVDEHTPHSEARTADVPPFVLSDVGRILLATLSAAAGVIHLVMVPSHANAWLAEGIAFATVGWLQLVVAGVLLTRPSQAVVRISCLANAVFVGAWVVSRVAGLPFGPEAGVPHDVGFVDLTVVVFEVALVVCGYELLARPDRGSRLPASTRSALSIVPVGILLLGTAAILSPSATDHAHAGGEGISAAGGHDHGGEAAAPVDDLGLSSVMNGQGDGGGHAHSAEVLPVDAATQAELDDQLDQTRALIDRYPTVAAAEAAGFVRNGPFVPGLGAHYMGAGADGVDISLEMTDEKIARPTLIYDGVEPESPLAGFMYNIFSIDTVNAPVGFAGPNDHWHYHTDVCVVPRPDGGLDSPLGADVSTTREICDGFGGSLIENTGYMLHVWTVPDYESAQGIFSNVNPGITCENGTYHVIPQEEYGGRNDVCRDA